MFPDYGRGSVPGGQRSTGRPRFLYQISRKSQVPSHTEGQFPEGPQFSLLLQSWSSEVKMTISLAAEYLWPAESAGFSKAHGLVPSHPLWRTEG